MRKPRKKNLWWIVGATGAYLFTQFKLILPLFKLGTFGGTILTMIISIGAIAMIAPFQLAVGVVVLLLVHEMGHVLAARQKGLPTSAPVFIPFLGAMINMKRNPRDAQTEAYIAFGGPLIGTLGAFVAFLIGLIGEFPIFIAIASVGFMINLLNLLPIHPLDGGRISVAVSRWLWVVGLIGGIVIIIQFELYLMLFFWMLFAFDLYRKYVSGRGNTKLHTSWASYEVMTEPILARGILLPEQEYQRELDFHTYSELGGKQVVMIYWPDVGLKGRMILPGPGLIEKVYVSRIDRVIKEKGHCLIIRCNVNYYDYDNNHYYEVPVRVKLLYALAYVCLALILIYMVYFISVTGMTKA